MPQAAAVWSADPEQLWSFPVGFLAEFFENHGMLELRNRPQWLTVVGGSRTYVQAIAGPLGERLRTSTPVERIERLAPGVEVTWPPTPTRRWRCSPTPPSASASC